MNKKEFFEARARMRFEREKGATKVPPGSASGSGPAHWRLGKSHARAKATFTSAARRMSVHPTDESGAAAPIRSQKMRRPR